SPPTTEDILDSGTESGVGSTVDNVTDDVVDGIDSSIDSVVSATDNVLAGTDSGSDTSLDNITEAYTGVDLDPAEVVQYADFTEMSGTIESFIDALTGQLPTTGTGLGTTGTAAGTGVDGVDTGVTPVEVPAENSALVAGFQSILSNLNTSMSTLNLADDAVASIIDLPADAPVAPVLGTYITEVNEGREVVRSAISSLWNTANTFISNSSIGAGLSLTARQVDGAGESGEGAEGGVGRDGENRGRETAAESLNRSILKWEELEILKNANAELLLDANVLMKAAEVASRCKCSHESSRSS
ncbi:MAG: hypothetical protein ACYTFY_23350, partial [Planctomycetota bacterium]